MNTLYTSSLLPLPLTPTKAITKALEEAPAVLLVSESPPTRQAAAVALLDAAIPLLSGKPKADAMNARDRLTGALKT